MGRHAGARSDLAATWAERARARGVDPAAVDPVLVVEQQLRDAEVDRNFLLADRWLAICDRRYRSAAMDQVDQPDDILAALTAWLAFVQRGEGDNLVMIGDYGVGKTYAAVAMARELHFGGWRIGFHNVPDLLDGIRRRAFDDLPGPDVAGLAGLDVLFLDDLGAEKPSEWTVEQLYRILDGRYRREAPTVVISNLAAGQLRDWIGQRTYERLRDRGAPLIFRGESRRQPKPLVVPDVVKAVDQ